MGKLKSLKLFSKKFIAWVLVICLILLNLPTMLTFAEMPEKIATSATVSNGNGVFNKWGIQKWNDVAFEVNELSDITIEFQDANGQRISINGQENPITTKENSNITNFNNEADQFAKEINSNAAIGKEFSHWAWDIGETSIREDFDSYGLDVLDKNYVFYAVMKDSEYSITYYDEDRTKYTDLEPNLYIASSNDITLPTLSKKDYTFLGWTRTNDDNDTMYIMEIPTATTGNKVFYANWRLDTDSFPETVEIKFVAGANGILIGDATEEVETGQSLTSVPTATPNTDYKFKGWYLGDVLIGDDEAVIAHEIKTTSTFTAKFYLDKNDNNIDDEAEHITITFLPGTNGSFANGARQITHKNLLPGYDRYPIVPKLNIDNGYNLTGWYDANNVGYTTNTTTIIPVGTKSATYTAQYMQYPPVDPETVTVKFLADVNGTLDGTTVEEVKIDGSVTSVPTVKPNTGYKFKGWYVGDVLIGNDEVVKSHEIRTATTFTAKFYIVEDNNVDDEYITITFLPGTGAQFADDSTTIFTNIADGTTWDEAEIVVPDATALLGFSGTVTWTPVIPLGTTVITGDLQFVANFARTQTGASNPGSENSDPDPETYTVKFMRNVTGEEITIARYNSVEAGDSVHVPTPPTIDGYTFSGWSANVGEVSNVQSDLTIVANYNPTVVITPNQTPLNPTTRSYTVTFMTPDGTVLGTDTVFEGQDATAPTNTGIAGFIFTGWNTDYTNIQGSLTVTAVYVAETTQGTTQGAAPGTAQETAPETTQGAAQGVAPGTTLETTSKITTGVIIEDDDVPLAPGLVIPEEDEEGTFTVRFLDYDGGVLSEQKIVAGTGAEAPVDPAREGYGFTSWSEDFAIVTDDMDIVAQYTEVFKIEEGKTLVRSHTIDDEATPLGTIELDDNTSAWSLFDLISTILTTLSVLIYMMKRKKKDEEDEEQANDTEKQENRQKNKKYGIIIGGLLAVVSIVLLILTQDFTAPMAIFDRYSLWFALIVVTQMLQMLVLGRKKEENEETTNA